MSTPARDAAPAQPRVLVVDDDPTICLLGGETLGAAGFSVDAAADGETVEETVEDTLKWWATLPAERQGKLKAGIAPDKEAKGLAAWKEAKKAAKG